MANEHEHRPAYFFPARSPQEKHNRYKRESRYRKYCKVCGKLIVEADSPQRLTGYQLLNYLGALVCMVLIGQKVLPRWFICVWGVIFFAIDYAIFRQRTWVLRKYRNRHRR